jgi:hypothetical protein
MQCPKRKPVANIELGIQVINEIQPAILQGTAVGFDLAKSKSAKGAAVLFSDLHNYLVLTRSFFHRDYLCRNRAHQIPIFSRSGRLESRCLLLQIRFLAQSPNRGLKLISQTHRIDRSLLEAGNHPRRHAPTASLASPASPRGQRARKIFHTRFETDPREGA